MKLINSTFIVFSFFLFTILSSCGGAGTAVKPIDHAQSNATLITSTTYLTDMLDDFPTKGDLFETEAVIVDDKGKELTKIEYNFDGSESGRTDFVYDEKGVKIKGNHFEEGELYMIYEYEYDEQGREISFTAKDPDIDLAITSGASQYADDGSRYDGVVNSDGKFKKEYGYLFDEKNRMNTYANFTSGTQEIFLVEYEEDNADGEWVTRHFLNTEDGTSEYIEERTFEAIK